MAAVPHILYEVPMQANAPVTELDVSGTSLASNRYGRNLARLITASGDNYGFAAWGPRIMPHVVYTIGLQLIALPSSIRIRAGIKSGGATQTLPVTINVPTECVSSIMHYSFAVPRMLQPGQQLVLWVTAVPATPSDAPRGVAYLLVESFRSLPTDRSQIVTYLATV